MYFSKSVMPLSSDADAQSSAAVNGAAAVSITVLSQTATHEVGAQDSHGTSGTPSGAMRCGSQDNALEAAAPAEESARMDCNAQPVTVIDRGDDAGSSSVNHVNDVARDASTTSAVLQPPSLDKTSIASAAVPPTTSEEALCAPVGRGFGGDLLRGAALLAFCRFAHGHPACAVSDLTRAFISDEAATRTASSPGASKRGGAHAYAVVERTVKAYCSKPNASAVKAGSAKLWSVSADAWASAGVSGGAPALIAKCDVKPALKLHADVSKLEQAASVPAASTVGGDTSATGAIHFRNDAVDVLQCAAGAAAVSDALPYDVAAGLQAAPPAVPRGVAREPIPAVPLHPRVVELRATQALYVSDVLVRFCGYELQPSGGEAGMEGAAAALLAVAPAQHTPARSLGTFATAPHVAQMLDMFVADWEAGGAAAASLDVATASAARRWPEAHDAVLAHLVQGSSARLSVLAAAAADALVHAGAHDTPALRIAVADRIPRLAERKAHGLKQPKGISSNEALEDMTAALWRWEVTALDTLLLLPTAVAKMAAASAGDAGSDDDDALANVAGDEAPSSATKKRAPVGDRALRVQITRIREQERWLRLLGERVRAVARLADAITAARGLDASAVIDAEERLQKAERNVVAETEKQAALDAKRRAAHKAKEAHKSAPNGGASSSSKAAALSKASQGQRTLFATWRLAGAASISEVPTSVSNAASPGLSSPAVAAVAAADGTPVVSPAPAPEAAAAAVAATPARAGRPLPQNTVLPHGDAAVAKRARRETADAHARSRTTWAAVDAALCSQMPLDEVRSALNAWIRRTRGTRAADAALRLQERAKAVAAARAFLRDSGAGESDDRDVIVVDLASPDGADAGAAAAPPPAVAVARLRLAHGCTPYKLFAFGSDARPAFYGTWNAARQRERTAALRQELAAAAAEAEEELRYRGTIPAPPTPPFIDVLTDPNGSGPRPRLRRTSPFGVDPSLFVYEVDSEAEWEEGEGAAMDVTDLEKASDGEDEEDEDEEDGAVKPDRGERDAAAYDYRDQWLATDDVIEYEDADAAVAGAQPGQDGAALTLPKPGNTPAAAGVMCGGVPIPSGGSVGAVLFAAGSQLTYGFDWDICSTAVAVGTVQPARQRAWLTELAGMRIQAALLPRSVPAVPEDVIAGGDTTAPQLHQRDRVALVALHGAVDGEPLTAAMRRAAQDPVPGSAEAVSTAQDGASSAAAATGRGPTKRSVEPELLPMLLRLTHGSMSAETTVKRFL